MNKINKILEQFKEWIIQRKPISPEAWLDSAQKLNIFLEDIDNEIDYFEIIMSEYQRKLLEENKSVAKTEILKYQALSKDDLVKYKRLKSLRIRINEHIRLAKRRATTTFNNMISN